MTFLSISGRALAKIVFMLLLPISAFSQWGRTIADNGEALGRARIDPSASGILEGDQVLVRGYKIQCTGDEGRILAGYIPGVPTTNEQNGVDYSLSQLFAAARTLHLHFRRDSKLFDQLHPATQKVILESLDGPQNYLSLRLQGSGSAHVHPILFDGLDVPGRNIVAANENAEVTSFNFQTLEQIIAGKSNVLNENSTQLVWKTPAEIPLAEEHNFVRDAVLVLSSNLVLKMERNSGYPQGKLGFYKDSYLNFREDLDGDTVDQSIIPKPFLVLNCNLVRTTK